MLWPDEPTLCSHATSLAACSTPYSERRAALAAFAVDLSFAVLSTERSVQYSTVQYSVPPADREYRLSTALARLHTGRTVNGL